MTITNDLSVIVVFHFCLLRVKVKKPAVPVAYMYVKFQSAPPCGGAIVVSVHPDRKANWNKINEVMSFYGKDGFRDFWNKSLPGVRYLNDEKGLEWLTSKGLQLPKEKSIKASSPSIVLKSDLVNKGLFQESDNLDGADKTLTENVCLVADWEAKKADTIAKLPKGKNFEEQDQIKKQVEFRIDTMKKAIEADRNALNIAKENTSTLDQRKRQAVADAVADPKRRSFVPEAWLNEFANDKWASDELTRRQDLRD